MTLNKLDKIFLFVVPNLKQNEWFLNFITLFSVTASKFLAKCENKSAFKIKNFFKERYKTFFKNYEIDDNIKKYEVDSAMNFLTKSIL